MKRVCIFVALLSLLATAGWAREFSSVAHGDTLIVEFKQPKDDGDGIAADDLSWPSNIGDFIAEVNAKHGGEFFVEVSNDSTSWKWVQQTLQKNPAAAKINFRGMNRMSDGGLAVNRQQTALRWLQEMSLTHLAVRNIVQYKPLQTPFIKIYPVIPTTAAPLEEAAAPIFIESQPDTTVMVYLAVDDDEFSLGAGLEWVAVKNGEPIVVPAFTAEYRKLCWLFAGTGGYGSFGNNEFGSEDQKLFAASATWLPNGSGFGLLAKFVYASRSVEDVGEYVQQGYGPYLGLAYRGEHLAFHLAGGVQYFDRYQSNRHSELSATAGCRYNFNF